MKHKLVNPLIYFSGFCGVVVFVYYMLHFQRVINSTSHMIVKVIFMKLIKFIFLLQNRNHKSTSVLQNKESFYYFWLLVKCVRLYVCVVFKTWSSRYLSLSRVCLQGNLSCQVPVEINEGNTTNFGFTEFLKVILSKPSLLGPSNGCVAASNTHEIVSILVDILNSFDSAAISLKISSCKKKTSE